MMNKLFDLRFVIGLFFLAVGILLVIYGLAGDGGINLWAGAGFGVFGLVMIFISRK